MTTVADWTQIKNQIWDYIVVGTGMGGGPLGLRLASQGFSVLFLEKGRSPQSVDSLSGQPTEFFINEQRDLQNLFQRTGRFSEEIYDCSPGRKKKYRPYMGSGVGGSSAIYGTILQRFKPSDFENWPIQYSELERYYKEAEDLFQVKQTSTYRHEGYIFLAGYLKNLNLNPYRLPFATEDKQNCSVCQSYLCRRECKMESGRVCVKKACDTYHAKVVTECEVLRFQIEDESVSAVEVFYQNSVHVLKARKYVLSAGALFSPLILMASRSEKNTHNYGIYSSVVGRYLMRHYVDLYGLKIDTDPKNPNEKELGFDDFYRIDNQTFGTVQSFGRPPIETITAEISSPLYLPKWCRKVLSFLLGRLLGGQMMMASIIEDSPNYNNRVWKEGGKTCLSYEISEDDQKRIQIMRKKLKTVFGKLLGTYVANAEQNKMLAHNCGTCRMGLDPKSSVVDTSCRVHGLQNLYVVDSSFFPTSGGTNPALTIAANSLRVADLLLVQDQLSSKANGVSQSNVGN